LEYIVEKNVLIIEYIKYGCNFVVRAAWIIIQLSKRKSAIQKGRGMKIRSGHWFLFFVLINDESMA
jgi:hypothetical protein